MLTSHRPLLDGLPKASLYRALQCDLGLRDALDPPIFAAARAANATVMTKDADFAKMVERFGPPPRVIWLRCGNTSNAALKDLLIRKLPECIVRLADGNSIVELGQASDSETGVGADSR